MWRFLVSASSWLLVVLAASPVTLTMAAEEPKAEKESPIPGVPASPLAAVWKFSADEGKTYGLDSLPAIKSGGKAPIFGRCEFAVDDPDRLGALWFATSDDGGICPVDEFRIGHRYLAMPLVLLNARLSLNGKPVSPEMDDVVFRRIGIDPKLLKAGANVIAFSGQGWNSLHNARVSREVAPAFRLLTSPPDALALRTGPVLGPIGEDYFTLACRTHIPCELQVKVKPTVPAGPETVHSFPRGTLHRAKMPLPKGTRKFQYTVTAVNGAHRKADGPHEVRVPDATKGLRFIVLGQTACNDGGKGLVRAAEAIRKTDPDFIIHTGSITLMAYWDFYWDDCFFGPWHDLLAVTPICVIPAYKDCYSQAFARLFYYPTENGAWDFWSWGVGPVRFIGLDGLAAAANPDVTAKWLSEQLQAAQEEYLFDVTAYPAYTTNPFGRGQAGHDYDKKVIHPLLAKYKATASLGCTGKYEYIAAPNAQSVPSIITGGVGAPMAPGWSKYQYCIFEIKDAKCHMTAVAYETGEVLDKRSFAPRTP